MSEQRSQTLPSPPNGEVRLVEDVGLAFAELVAAEIAAATEASPELFRLALSGGSTARGCYEELAALDVDWDLVECYLGDERCVPPDDPDTNQSLVREALLSRLERPPIFHPMECDRSWIYAERLASFDGFDLVHLGLGPDAHTASLFAGSSALSPTPGALVALTEDPTGQNLHPRMTLTLLALARAKLSVFTVAGAAKREALRRVLDGEDVPASRVASERVIWLCDADALGDAVIG